MARPRKPPEVSAAVLELHRKGMSRRAIYDACVARGIEVGEGTIGDIVRRARSVPAQASAARQAKPQTPDPPASAPVRELAAEVARVTSDVGSLDLVGLRDLDRRLDEALELVEEPKVLVSLTDCKMRLAQAIMRLIPPPTPDPNADLGNVEAADLLVRQLEQLVVDVERARGAT